MFEPAGGAPRYFGGPGAFTIRIELANVEPVVWRQFVVASETKLPKFNRLLEAVMGWQGYHLHAFEVADLRFGEPDPDFADSTIDERKITVGQLLPRVGSVAGWVYDFGDNWSHRLEVVAAVTLDPAAKLPACLDGERACPPEDCGGPWGYADLLKVLADPSHDEYEHLSQWAGDDFDAERFDADEVTKRLRKVR